MWYGLQARKPGVYAGRQLHSQSGWESSFCFRSSQVSMAEDKLVFHNDYLIMFDYSNKSMTLPFEMRKNIMTIALSPQATILITVDEGNE